MLTRDPGRSGPLSDRLRLPIKIKRPTIGQHGLKVILGTPTACPPKWLIDAHPDVLPFDSHENPRKFGSRRHYSFSSDTFRKHTEAICRAMAYRYGKHPAVVGWQLDNEYGCHHCMMMISDSIAVAFKLLLVLQCRRADRDRRQRCGPTARNSLPLAAYGRGCMQGMWRRLPGQEE